MLVSLVQDVIRVLSQIEGCRQPLQQRAVPTIVSILDAHEEKVALGLKAVALDVLEILVRGSAQVCSFVLIRKSNLIIYVSFQSSSDQSVEHAGVPAPERPPPAAAGEPFPDSPL